MPVRFLSSYKNLTDMMTTGGFHESYWLCDKYCEGSFRAVRPGGQQRKMLNVTRMHQLVNHADNVLMCDKHKHITKSCIITT